MIRDGKITHPNAWIHPQWCDPRSCRMDNVGTNIEHELITGRWKASEPDIAITVSLSKLDEIFQGDQLLESSPAAAVRFEDLWSREHAATAHLDAEDCRQLALHLLEVADQLEAPGRPPPASLISDSTGWATSSHSAGVCSHPWPGDPAARRALR